MLQSELPAIPSNHHTVRTLEAKTTSHGLGASRYRTQQEEQAFLTRACWRRSRGRGASPRQPARRAAGTQLPPRHTSAAAATSDQAGISTGSLLPPAWSLSPTASRCSRWYEPGNTPEALNNRMNLSLTLTTATAGNKREEESALVSSERKLVHGGKRKGRGKLQDL